MVIEIFIHKIVKQKRKYSERTQWKTLNFRSIEKMINKKYISVIESNQI